MNPAADKVKVRFHVAQDADGYPPAEYAVETLWATHLGELSFQIDNIPFFARDSNR